MGPVAFAWEHFHSDIHGINLWDVLENYIFLITAQSPKGHQANELTYWGLSKISNPFFQWKYLKNQKVLCDINMTAILQELHMNLICYMCSEITLLTLNVRGRFN